MISSREKLAWFANNIIGKNDYCVLLYESTTYQTLSLCENTEALELGPAFLCEMGIVSIVSFSVKLSKWLLGFLQIALLGNIRKFFLL